MTASGETGSGTIRVLIVDDHPVVSVGVERLLQTAEGVDVAGHAESVAAALEAVTALAPDVVLLDLTLGDEDGLELLERLPTDPSAPRVLIFSARDPMVLAQRVLSAGAMGFVQKGSPIPVLIDAIHRVARGEVVVSHEVEQRLMQGLRGGRSAEMVSALLSKRELQVYDLLGRGLTTKEIGRRLEVSAKTVFTHRSHIMEKLELSTAAELVRSAVLWVEALR